MVIKIWSDYACPFCYIGEKRLEKALADVKADIKIEFIRFELDPTADKNVVSSTTERFAIKYCLPHVTPQKNLLKTIKIWRTSTS